MAESSQTTTKARRTRSQIRDAPSCLKRVRTMPESSPTSTKAIKTRRWSMDEPLTMCDICDERKLKAFKSCLVCQSYYCETHLEPHLRVASLKKHKLMEPVSNLEDYICQKHERPLELYCRDDQTIVCLSCTDGDHKKHDTVSLKETQLVIEDTQQMIKDRIKKIKDIKHSVDVRKRKTEKEKAARVELFTDLIHSIERCQTELLEMMEEQQKEAEKQEQDLIKELEQEITELEMRNIKLQQLSRTEDLIPIFSSQSSPTNTRNWPEISVKTHESLKTLRKALTQLKGTLDEKLTQTELKWMQQYAVDVTLDPDTAYSKLILSNDGKQVRHGDIWQNLPDNPKRFDRYANVLAKEGFSSGKFYFEVRVKGKTDWTLGVARESITRKGKSLRNEVWTVWLRNGNVYWACADFSVPLCLRVKPQRVGVFVDYKEGQVSFYDVQSSSHIHSYTGQSFTEKLYPYFSPCSNYGGQNSRPLIITPVSYNKCDP